MSAAGPVGVVGAGAWGTTLAAVLAKKGHDVRLWSFEPEVAEEIDATGVNPYLPDAPLPSSLRATHDLAEAVSGAAVVVSASPAQFVRSVMSRAAAHVAPDAVVISASKGIEISTQLRMDEVLAQVLPRGTLERFVALSGPSFAREVIEEAPTAVVVASPSGEAAAHAQSLFQTPYFRVYTNRDVIGVELGGALKNVIALAAGMSAGLGFGHNTTAALITRGLAEITRLGVAMGADRATFSGLAGMGDLVLTCTGGLSRNRTVGFRLGQGEALEDVLGDMTAVAEGVTTVEAVHALARRLQVEMPISQQVYSIVHEGRRPDEALKALMLRDPKPEEWS